jgi:hypothetical protein
MEPQIGIREGEEHGRKPHHIVSMEPQIGIREGTRQIAPQDRWTEGVSMVPRLVSGKVQALAPHSEQSPGFQWSPRLVSGKAEPGAITTQRSTSVSMEPQIGIRGRATLDPGYRFVAFSMEPQIGIRTGKGTENAFVHFRSPFVQRSPRLVSGEGMRNTKNCKFTRSFNGAPDRYPSADGKRKWGKSSSEFQWSPRLVSGEVDKDQTILRFVSLVSMEPQIGIREG